MAVAVESRRAELLEAAGLELALARRRRETVRELAAGVEAAVDVLRSPDDPEDRWDQDRLLRTPSWNRHRLAPIDRLRLDVVDLRAVSADVDEACGRLVSGAGPVGALETLSGLAARWDDAVAVARRSERAARSGLPSSVACRLRRTLRAA